MIKKKRVIAWDKFGTLKSKNELETYLIGYEYNHSKFCHYTSCDTINKILSNNSFFLSKVTGFNDKIDTMQFGEDKDFYFSLSFSTGINENLSLWYLYSGIDGRGGRIVFTPALLKNMLAEEKYSLCIFRKDGNQLVYEKPLSLDKDFKLTFQDVLYYKYCDEKKCVDLKYNTMTNHNFPIYEFDLYKSENIGFYKNLIWYYEKETRLVALLTESDCRQRIESMFQNEYAVIRLNFDEKIYKKLQIDFAPEIGEFESVFDNYEHIKTFFDNTERVNYSLYKGQLEMDLCRNCNRYTKNK